MYSTTNVCVSQEVKRIQDKPMIVGKIIYLPWHNHQITFDLPKADDYFFSDLGDCDVTFIQPMGLPFNQVVLSCM